MTELVNVARRSPSYRENYKLYRVVLCPQRRPINRDNNHSRLGLCQQLDEVDRRGPPPLSEFPAIQPTHATCSIS